MMMWIFGLMISCGIAFFVADGNGPAALDALINGAGQALDLTLSLAGAYMLWLGLFNIASEAGVIDALAKLMRRPLKRLLPNAGEAIAPVTLNLAANFFGLGNAATPFGVEAMKRLSDGSGTATDDMCMFAALNASAVELLPTTVIAIRSACGSGTPFDIVLPTFIASVAAALAAVLGCRLLSKLGKRRT